MTFFKQNNKEYELLLEKYKRHEQILIQAYKSLKQKEEALKKLNGELCESEKALKETNDELLEKNDIIQNQNSELKATLQYLKETQSQLLHSEKMASLGILTSGVAHEINNPLNYIMGSYVGLNSYFEENKIDNPKINYLLNSLKTGIDKAVKIVKGLGQFSLQSSSNNEQCDIHSILDNCLVMYQNQFRDKIVRERDYCNEKLTVRGNIGNLHQVFSNILTNAVQSIEDCGYITIRTSKRNENVIVEIIDSGIGISEDILSSVTDPFFTTRDPGKGVGLGLSIVYNLVKEHMGKLDIRSTLGEGTKVRIELPIL